MAKQLLKMYLAGFFHRPLQYLPLHRDLSYLNFLVRIILLTVHIIGFCQVVMELIFVNLMVTNILIWQVLHLVLLIKGINHPNVLLINSISQGLKMNWILIASEGGLHSSYDFTTFAGHFSTFRLQVNSSSVLNSSSGLS